MLSNQLINPVAQTISGVLPFPYYQGLSGKSSATPAIEITQLLRERIMVLFIGWYWSNNFLFESGQRSAKVW